jgi:hypothetical protein
MIGNYNGDVWLFEGGNSRANTSRCMRIQEWLVKQNQARSFGESIKVEKQLKIQGPKK